MVYIFLITAAFNAPWKRVQEWVAECCCITVLTPKYSRAYDCFRLMGVYIWSAVGLPLSIMLFILAINGTPHPDQTAARWAPSLLASQLGFDNAWALLFFTKQYRNDVREARHAATPNITMPPAAAEVDCEAPQETPNPLFPKPEQDTADTAEVEEAVASEAAPAGASE